jgi:hypothetical protein
MDSVSSATAAKLGIPPADMHTNLRVNVRDGGVVSQIDRSDDPDLAPS